MCFNELLCIIHYLMTRFPSCSTFHCCRDLSFNNITGQVPQALLNLNSLNFLYNFLAFECIFLQDLETLCIVFFIELEAFIIYLANAKKIVPIRFLGNNSLSGSLPSSKGPNLKYLYVTVVQFHLRNKSRMTFIYNAVSFSLFRDFSYNQLSGSFPSWASQNLQL